MQYQHMTPEQERSILSLPIEMWGRQRSTILIEIFIFSSGKFTNPLTKASDPILFRFPRSLRQRLSMALFSLLF